MPRVAGSPTHREKPTHEHVRNNNDVDDALAQAKTAVAGGGPLSPRPLSDLARHLGGGRPPSDYSAPPPPFDARERVLDQHCRASKFLRQHGRGIVLYEKPDNRGRSTHSVKSNFGLVQALVDKMGIQVGVDKIMNQIAGDLSDS
ncbi:hypothetical protein HK405_006999 [Cladochytrium tenue]|nr:hypothetical protein HK405_006999 [Cladochytrium tenue]